MKTNDRLLLTAVLFLGLVTRPVFGDTKPDASIPPLIPPPSAAAAAAPAADTTPPPMPPPAPDAGLPAPTVSEPPAPKAATHTKKKSTKPAAKPVSKKAKSTKAKTTKPAASKIPEVSMPLKPGAATVTAKRVNLRGKPTIASEVLGHLTNSEPVTVIEEIRRDNKRPDDPDVWAKIALPASAHSWVHATFVDTNKIVIAKKLNVRGGPGENYSIVGQLKKGDAINQLNEKDGWLEIASPADAYVYVAAAYLRQEAPIVPVEPVPPAPEATPVVEGAPIAGAPAAPPEPTPAAAPTPEMAASPAMPAPNLPVILDPSIPRVVDREGIVRRTWSIQAPSDYRLVSPDTGESVVYLHTSSTNLDLSRYKGLHIIVTGEEGMDRRWKNVPVLTIRRIQVIE